MTLDEKIEKQKELRRTIRQLEQELFVACLDIEKDVLAECKNNTLITQNSYISHNSTGKKYVVDKLNVFFDQNGDPFLSPKLRRVRPDGITLGNVIDADNYLSSISITEKWREFVKTVTTNTEREYENFHQVSFSHILMYRATRLADYSFLETPKPKIKKVS